MPPLALVQQKVFLHDARLSLYIAFAMIALLTFGTLGLTWVGTNQQISISTTLTYAGRERSLTQKILAETLQTVYMHLPGTSKQLRLDEEDWSSRHDALWRGDHSLSVLSISTFPAIEGKITAVEPLYLRLHLAIDDVLSAPASSPTLRLDALSISKNAVPFYTAMETYNTYLRNLTTTYQRSILLYIACSAAAMILILLFSILVVFRPIFSKLTGNIVSMTETNTQLQHAKQDAEAILEEVRRADHGMRVPLVKVSEGHYAVQNGNRGYYSVEKRGGLLCCSCSIFLHNNFCNHIKCVQEAERMSQPLLPRSLNQSR